VHPLKEPDQIRVPELNFLGEQDGPPEQLLKRDLSDFFSRKKSIRRAYLAKVVYAKAKNLNVVLALRTEFGPDRGIVDEVGSIFAFIFNAEEHLDILFLSEGQEARLIKVCHPFFEQSTVRPV